MRNGYETVRIGMNTNLLPVVSIGMYESVLSPKSVFSDEFSRVQLSESLSEAEKSRIFDDFDFDAYEGLVGKYAKKELEAFFGGIRESRGYDIRMAGETGVYSPRQYNYGTDELDFTISLDRLCLSQIAADALADEKFWAWAGRRYRSYDGYICFMPCTRREYVEQLLEGQYDRTVAAYLTYIGVKEFNCCGEFGYTYCVYENMKGHGLPEFLDEEARGILNRVLEKE